MNGNTSRMTASAVYVGEDSAVTQGIEMLPHAHQALFALMQWAANKYGVPFTSVHARVAAQFNVETFHALSAENASQAAVFVVDLFSGPNPMNVH